MYCSKIGYGLPPVGLTQGCCLGDIVQQIGLMGAVSERFGRISGYAGNSGSFNDKEWTANILYLRLSRVFVITFTGDLRSKLSRGKMCGITRPYKDSKSWQKRSGRFSRQVTSISNHEL